jgi:hypothetical protein
MRIEEGPGGDVLTTELGGRGRLDLLEFGSMPGTGDPRRGAAFDATSLPVPADLLAYTVEEWERVVAEHRGPARDEIVWVVPPGRREDHPRTSDP